MNETQTTPSLSVAPEDIGLEASRAQRGASDPAASIWVGASAGSGKTKVLADRVTRLLLAGVAPQKILCLTFTRAAAAEMAIRLTQRLSAWATADEESLRREIDELEGQKPDPALYAQAPRLFARVLACPGGMRVQTIHGFAQEILRRFPIEAGLPPTFAVMDEAEAQNLWQDALDALLQSAADGSDEESGAALAQLVKSLGEDSLQGLLREATGKAAKLRALAAQDGPATAQRALYDAYGVEPGQDAAFFMAEATREDAFDRHGLLEAARLVSEKGSKLYTDRAEMILHWLEQDEAGRRHAFAYYQRAFLTTNGAPFKEVANKALIAENPAMEAALRDEQQRVERVLERMEAAQGAQDSAALLTLALKLGKLYETRKAAAAVLDYDDLIERARDVLTRKGAAAWVLYKLDGGVDHILVDESQDTNQGQWDIVDALTDEFFAGQGARADQNRTLFVVGDEKQSIFSFQGADPAAFERMRGKLGGKIRAGRKPFEEVPLNVSFRSAPSILRAVDAVFAREAVRQGVSHDPVRHRAFRAEGAGRVELWPLEPFAPRKDENGKGPSKTRLQTPEAWDMPLGYESAADPAAALAQSLAAQIKAWERQGVRVYDKKRKAERPMTPGDVLVLVQRRGPFVAHLVSALKAQSVPVSGVDRMILTQQLAVMDLTALMQFALLPEDDLTLASVLRGPLLGASEDELMRLAIGRQGSLWDSLKTNTDGENRFALFLSYLQNVAAMADETPPLQMLARLLGDPCPADPHSGRRALAARLGPDAEDPIDELLNAAEDFGARHAPSLQSFLHWLFSSETEVKREMEGAVGRVRIMTVHASKGLEAPIVILPDTVHEPGRKNLPRLLWDEANGLPFYVPRDTSCARPAALREEALRRQKEEYRRLLYVALTRPADRLLVCGYTKKEGAKEESWYSLVQEALAPLNQKETLMEKANAPIEPDIVLADYALTAAEEKTPEEQTPEKAAFPPPPPWLFAPPPPEPSPPRPLTPSRPAEEEPAPVSPQDSRFRRGRLMHRLLQSLPEIAAAERKQAALRFLSNPQHALSPAQQEEIAREILRLLDDETFAPLFGPQSRAEVPIVGLVPQQADAPLRLVSGQVDRLALVGGEVWIVDFKTNRPPPETAAQLSPLYHAQMMAYRAVLEQIYPDKAIRCFLLWTYAPRLMEVEA